MNVVIRYKGTILFNPDAIYCEGVMIKAKKGLDHYILCEYEDSQSAERSISEIWSELKKGKDKLIINIK